MIPAQSSYLIETVLELFAVILIIIGINVISKNFDYRKVALIILSLIVGIVYRLHHEIYMIGAVLGFFVFLTLVYSKIDIKRFDTHIIKEYQSKAILSVIGFVVAFLFMMFFFKTDLAISYIVSLIFAMVIILNFKKKSITLVSLLFLFLIFIVLYIFESNIKGSIEPTLLRFLLSLGLAFIFSLIGIKFLKKKEFNLIIHIVLNLIMFGIASFFDAMPFISIIVFNFIYFHFKKIEKKPMAKFENIYLYIYETVIFLFFTYVGSNLVHFNFIFFMKSLVLYGFLVLIPVFYFKALDKISLKNYKVENYLPFLGLVFVGFYPLFVDVTWFIATWVLFDALVIKDE